MYNILQYTIYNIHYSITLVYGAYFGIFVNFNQSTVYKIHSKQCTYDIATHTT